MIRLRYDFHIHSCLSPCGDEDMTPNNLVNMAKINELDIIALTDHNSCKNCPAAEKVAQEVGLIFVPGMELTTSEEAHVVCLFPDVETAMRFDAFVEENLPDIPNDAEIFGEQQIRDENDEIIGEVSPLLINATSISVDDVVQIVKEYGGAAFPAHIDKSTTSVISSLGVFPDWANFTTVEIRSEQAAEILKEEYPCLKDMNVLYDSDAHYLENIADPGNVIELEEATASALIKFLMKC